MGLALFAFRQSARKERAVNKIVGRNRLLPWYVGIVIILAAVIYVGYQVVATGRAAPAVSIVGVLVVIPVVYLFLMYLTLTSQE